MPMYYHVLVEIVVTLHLLFAAFAVFGVLLVSRWPKLMWLHIPAVVWSVVVNACQWVCPLTPLEITLQRLAGKQGEDAPFLERLLEPVLYPPIAHLPYFWLLLAGFVLLINVAGYTWIFRRRRRRTFRQDRPR